MANLKEKLGKSAAALVTGVALAGYVAGCSAETYEKTLPWNDCGISGHEYDNCRQKNNAPEYRENTGIWN